MFGSVDEDEGGLLLALPAWACPRRKRRCRRRLRRRQRVQPPTRLLIWDPQGSSSVLLLAVGPGLAHKPDRRGATSDEADSE
jgi:hypothetical protein